MMLIYQLPVSLYSFKLRLALRLKGIEITMMPPPGGTYRSPEFAGINPAGTIPTLVHGDLWLAETDAIIEYLDDLHLGVLLRPADAVVRARDRMLSRWCDMQLEPAVRRVFGHISPSRRNPAAVLEADAMISAKLAVMEMGLDPDGPFATGTSPAMADCGFAATMIWLEALTAPLSLNARPGPRLQRMVQALCTDTRTSREAEVYRELVRTMIAQAT
jgi:glutathione S-transferase